MVVDWEPEYNRGSVGILATRPGRPLQSVRSISSEVGSGPTETSKLPRSFATGERNDEDENPDAGPGGAAEEGQASTSE